MNSQKSGLELDEVMPVNDSPNIEFVIDVLMRLSEEERLEVFRNFCRSCGVDDRFCRCWDDE